MAKDRPASPARSDAGAIVPQLRVAGSASVLHKPGAVKLDGYPLLCYAPSQHGPGVRVASNGASVEAICLAVAEHSGNATSVAERFEVSEDEVAESVRYATEAGRLAPGE